MAAGLDGIKKKEVPPPPIQRNIYEMSVRDRRKHKVKELPSTLKEAVIGMQRNSVVKEALGSHIFNHFIEAKMLEFNEYRIKVHQWELDRYLAEY